MIFLPSGTRTSLDRCVKNLYIFFSLDNATSHNYNLKLSNFELKFLPSKQYNQVAAIRLGRYPHTQGQITENIR